MTVKGWVNPEGYRLIRAPGHPMTPKCGVVVEHRVVLYDALGEGEHPCHWCGRSLTWRMINVDHLDDDRANNDLANLVPACIDCNSRRSWRKQHLKDFAPHLVRAVVDAVPQASNVAAVIQASLRIIAHSMHSDGPMRRRHVPPVDLSHLARLVGDVDLTELNRQGARDGE